MSLAGSISSREQLKAGRVHDVLRRRIRELDLAPGALLRKEFASAAMRAHLNAVTAAIETHLPQISAEERR